MNQIRPTLSLPFSVSFLFASMAWAAQPAVQSLANYTASKQGVEASAAVRGLRLAVLVPMTREIKRWVRNDDFNLEGTSNFQTKDHVGVSVGYVNLKPKSLAVSSHLSYRSFKVLAYDESVDMSQISLDGNIGYAFNRILSLRGGLNVSRMSSGDGRLQFTTFSPGVGAQAILGLQFSDRWGADLTYVQSKSNYRFEQEQRTGPVKARGHWEQQGLEVSLTSTF